MNTSPAMPAPLLSLFGLVLASAAAWGGDTSPAQQLAYWSSKAGVPASAERGRVFFSGTHGGKWSCASCHGTPPTTQGRHAATGKSIAPLAPAANAEAFTDAARVEKWFRRNCNDVLSRECSAAEKADMLAYVNSLRP